MRLLGTRAGELPQLEPNTTAPLLTTTIFDGIEKRRCIHSPGASASLLTGCRRRCPWAKSSAPSEYRNLAGPRTRTSSANDAHGPSVSTSLRKMPGRSPLCANTCRRPSSSRLKGCVSDVEYRQAGGRAMRFEQVHQRAVGRSRRLPEQGHIVVVEKRDAPAVMQHAGGAPSRRQNVQRKRQTREVRTRQGQQLTHGDGPMPGPPCAARASPDSSRKALVRTHHHEGATSPQSGMNGSRTTCSVTWVISNRSCNTSAAWR